MITATPESIALAAGLIGQTKGDLAQARRAAGEAFAWLQSIDPSYKPEPANPIQSLGKSPIADAATIAELRAELAQDSELIAQLRLDVMLANTAADKLRDDLATWQDRALTAETKRDALKAELDGFKLRTAIASDSASKPQPAPQAPIKAQPVQAPAAVAADPYAGLPPKMRAFLATQASKLEID